MKQTTLLDLYSQHNNQLLLKHQTLLLSLIPNSVTHYYNLLLSTEETSRYLTNEIVEQHLQSALAEWMTLVLTPKTVEEQKALQARHNQIGEVHARINIDMKLVSQAMIVLKNSLYLDLFNHKVTDTDFILLIQNILDHALICINSAYFSDYENINHQSNVLANHLCGPDFAIVVEQMRTEIHKWLSKCLVENQIHTILDTEFALWIRHKLPLAISDKKVLKQVNDIIHKISHLHNTQPVFDATTAQNLTTDINELSWLLQEMAKNIMSSDDKKDPLTKVYNRRFLDSILLQETLRAQKLNIQYTIAMIDVDHFKSINDQYGHAKGDEVLAKLAETMSNHLRISDFIFRFGGEEFLIVLTECDITHAMHAIESLKQAVASIKFTTSDNTEFSLSFSAGLAQFDGQPDYQHTIKKADQAMYQAKENGRNQVIAWQET